MRKTKEGIEISYDKILEDKELPEYWHRKYILTHTRWRKFYGMRARNRDINPMHEVLVERISLLHVKMQYFESPDFKEDTGLNIENPLYMGKYDEMLKSMVKIVEQIQKYTESRPKAVAKKAVLKLKANVTADELKDLKNDVLDAEIAKLISGEEVAPEETIDGTEIKEILQSGKSESSKALDREVRIYPDEETKN